MNINVSHIYQDLGMEGGKNFYCINGASLRFVPLEELEAQGYGYLKDKFR